MAASVEHNGRALWLASKYDPQKEAGKLIEGIEHDKVACDILRIIGSLGQTLGMRITAEGVETVEQADFLRTIACHQLQGFYFSKPLAPDELPAFLAENLTGRIRQESGQPKKRGRRAVGDN